MNETPILSFRGDGPGVNVDLSRLVKGKLLLQASSGGGKSWAMRSLLEETHGKLQHLVIDPEGEFYTLREQFDYLLVGRKGEIPATVSTAHLLSRRLFELNTSAIFDLQDLETAEQQAYVGALLRGLMGLGEEWWRPCLVAIDEMPIFAPQAGDVASSAAVKSLASRGRKRGYGLVMATQRISRIHKDLVETENKMIGRTVLDTDVDRAASELGLRGEDKLSLYELGDGEFYVQGRAFGVPRVTRVRTGAVRTTHPDPDQLSRAVPAPPAPAAIQALIRQFQDLPDAEEDAGAADPEELQRLRGELAGLRTEQESLRAQLGAAEAEVVRLSQLPAVEKKVWLPAEIGLELLAASKQLNDCGQALSELTARILPWTGPADPEHDEQHARQLAATTRPEPNLMRAFEGLLPERTRRELPRTEREPARTEAPREVPAPKPPSDGKLHATQQRILDAIAAFGQLGLTRPSRANVATWANLAAGSGSFNAHLTSLKRAGLIEYADGSRLTLTAEGRTQARVSQPIRSVQELQQAWLRRLPDPQRRKLQVVIAAHPAAVHRDEIGRQLGLSSESGSFAADITALRDLGLVEYPRPRYVKATRLLFPEGVKA